MKNFFIISAVLFLMCFLSASSHATPIRIDFTGTIDSVGAGVAGGGIFVDDSVTGHFSYDTETPDTFWDAADNTKGEYRTLTQTFNIMIGSSFSATSSSTTITVQNNFSNGSAPVDGLYVTGNPASGGTLNGRDVHSFQIGLTKNNSVAHLWSDDFLPDATDWAGVSLSDMNAPGWRWMKFDWRSGDTRFDAQIRWNITSFNLGSSTVPEPATMMLFGFGVLGLAGISRRKK